MVYPGEIAIEGSAWQGKDDSMQRSLETNRRTAAERTMSVQEVILRGWQRRSLLEEAEIIGSAPGAALAGTV